MVVGHFCLHNFFTLTENQIIKFVSNLRNRYFIQLLLFKKMTKRMSWLRIFWQTLRNCTSLEKWITIYTFSSWIITQFYRFLLRAGPIQPRPSSDLLFLKTLRAKRVSALLYLPRFWSVVILRPVVSGFWSVVGQWQSGVDVVEKQVADPVRQRPSSVDIVLPATHE